MAHSATVLDVLCIGEALADLVATRRGPLRSAPAFRLHAGGAPANVARGLARLGARAGWCGAVGADEFGTFLLETLAADGVDVSRAVRVAGAKTGVCFIALDEAGERSFLGYGQPDASRFLEPAALDAAYVGSARIVHCGSNTLVSEPARSATLTALALARDADRLTSLDVNLRLHLWEDPARPLAEARQVLGGIDLVKASHEEARLLTGTADALEAARTLRRWGAGVAVVTLSDRGCVFSAPHGEGAVAAYRVDVVDTTGAGDAFQAALLRALLPYVKDGRAPAQLVESELVRALDEANRAGAAAVGREGAVSWRPEDLPSSR